MPFIVIVKATLRETFSHWVESFDAAAADRAHAGVETVFRAPVVGEQAVTFAMRTDFPRLVHDMMYHPEVRPGIEASGLVVGSEIITICEADV